MKEFASLITANLVTLALVSVVVVVCNVQGGAP